MPADVFTYATISGLLADLNECWVSGDPNDTGKYLHQNVVFVNPESPERIEGKAACVEGYAEFRRQTKLLSFEQTDPQIDVIGDTAIAMYLWTIEYESAGETVREVGSDMYVLHRELERWLIVWRTLIV